MYYHVKSDERVDDIIVSGPQMLDDFSTEGDYMVVEGSGYCIVVDGGELYVSSGGKLTETDIQNYGTATIYDGGSAQITAVGDCASLYLYGMTEYTTVFYTGNFFVGSGGTANINHVEDGGTLIVGNGGIANENVIDYGDAELPGNFYISSGGIANDTTVINGRFEIASGGKAYNATVSSDCYLIISSGGTITGEIVFEDGAVISAYSGAIINFDFTLDATSYDYAPVNDLSLVQGSPDYTLTVDGSSEAGDYILAGGAAAFSSTISVVNTAGESLGTVTLDTPATISDVNYALSLSGDSLVLSVGGGIPEPVVVSGLVLINETRTVSADELYQDTAVNSGGSLRILSGGTADSTTINSGGRLTVSSGGTATEVKENGGCVFVSEGADVTFVPNAVNGLVLKSGGATVHSGTTLNSVTVSSQGRLDIYSGGTANSLIVSAGSLFVSSGGKLTGNMSFRGGGGARVSVGMGGIIDFDLTQANPWRVFASGSWVQTDEVALVDNLSNVQGAPTYTLTVDGTLANGAYLLVERATNYTGASAMQNPSDTLMPGFTGTITVQNKLGETIGTLTVGEGATTIAGVEYTLYLSDALTVYVSNPYTVFSSGLVLTNEFRTVSAGELYQDTAVNSGGSLRVLSGGKADNTAVNSGGSLRVLSSGMANSTTVNSGGKMNVSRGGMADSTTINSGGNVWVSSGGSVNSTTVNSGGNVWVSSGGTATDINWTPCEGHVYVFEGGYATFVSQYSGVYYGSGNQLLSNAAVMDGMTIRSSCEMNVMSGGTADRTRVSSYGYLYVSRGGTADSTTVNIGGKLFVNSGGMADSTTVSSGGEICISSGGTATNVNMAAGAWFGFNVASNTYVQGTSGGATFEMKDASLSNYTIENGSVFVYDGGTANSTIVNSRGNLYVSSGGTATEVRENGGYVQVADGADVTFVPNTFRELILSAGNATVHSGTTADMITVRDGSSMSVFSGGTAYNTEATSRGSLVISSGGVANNVFVRSAGIINLSSGGKLTGKVICLDGVVSAGSGAIVDFDLTHKSPGAASLYFFDSDRCLIQGAPTYTITVNSDQAEGLYSLSNYAGGFDKQITVQNTEGTALGVLSVGETVTVSDTAYTLNITDNQLFLKIGENDTPSPYTSDGVVVYAGQRATVSSGEIYHDTEIWGGQMFVLSGGTADIAFIHAFNGYGSVFISSGGMANNVMVNSICYLTVSSGATAKNTTVKPCLVGPYGGLFVQRGGKLTGQTVISSGAIVSVGEGAILDFDISEVAPGAAARFNDLSLIGGEGLIYTLTVSGTEASGVYTLAEGAADFTGTIRVQDTLGKKIGSLMVGTPATISDVNYALSLSEGILSLQITALPLVVSGLVLENDSRIVRSGDTYKNTIIKSGGRLHVTEDGTADITRVSSGGELYVTGGTANKTTVSSGGSVHVSVGGIVNSTMVSSGGSMHVSVGGIANRTGIMFNGIFIVSSGGTANDTSNSEGSFIISSGGTANNIVSGGFTVCAGGVVNGATIGRNMSVSSGAVLNNVVIDGGSVTILSGGTMNDTLLKGRNFLILSGGVANNTIISGSGLHDRTRCLVIYSGGTANNTAVKYGMRTDIWSGGTANGTVVEGVLTIFTSGLANRTIVSSGGVVNFGDLQLDGAGVADTITVSSGGTVNVISGGKLTGKMTFVTGATVSMTTGATLDFDLTRAAPGGAARVNDLSIIQGTPNFTITVDGTQENGFYTLAANAEDFNSTITVQNTLGESLGTLTVGNSAIISKVKYALSLSSGKLSLQIANVVSGLVVKNGYRDVLPGAVYVRTTVSSGGVFRVSSGGTATEILEKGGYVDVIDGATVTFTPNTFSGLVLSSASATIHSGTTANSTTVNLSGNLYVSNGGTANNTTIVNGGFARVFSGGIAENTTLGLGGLISIVGGGTANRTTVNYGGRLMASGGGTANQTTVNSGGKFIVLVGNVNIGSLDGRDSDPNADLYSSVTVYETTVNSSGIVEVSSGGTLDTTTVNSGGRLNISRGGRLTGQLRFENGAVVFASSGAILDFDLTGTTAGGAALVNDLSIIHGTPNFTITVDGTQENGDYFLAEGANSFNGTIIVVNTDGDSLGELNAGETITVSQTSYTLSLSGSSLVLSVGETSVEPVVHTDFAVSDFIVPTAFAAGEDVSFSWNLTNNGEQPIEGVRQSLYLVNADDSNRKMLLKSVYLTDLPGFGETTAQTMDLTWSDSMGYANSLFQVIVEADGDIRPDDNTAVSTSQYHFEQKLFIEKLPDSFTENAGRIRVVARRTGSPDEALSAEIVLTDAGGLVSAPETVSFAAGESEKVFYLTVGDNTEYQGSADIQIGLQAQGYEEYSQTVTVTDDEKPSLSISVAAEELTEGDTFTTFGKVQLDHALDHDLRVKLAYDKTQLSGIPDYVVIRAGEIEAVFALTVIDNATAEIDKNLKLTATADGVNGGTASLLIHDNDVPAIALSVNKTVISEGDGAYALVGTITRTDDSTNYVKVKFVDVDNSGLILPSTVTLGTGAKSVNFYIGIVDNTLVDGDRTATVKANIYIDSCGCTVIPVSGETQISFTILDNDGEALGLSFNKSNVAENTAKAARLTITRNTVNGEALTVNLNVAGSSLLDLPETVQFEAGQNSITIDVNTLTDGVHTGNQIAVVTASAEGYASAAGYLNISDVNLPDFVISEVAPAETPAYAGKTTLVNLTLANNGFQAYSGKVNVKLSLSNGTELGTYKVNGPFGIGETRQVGFYVNLPEITGTQTILAEVDPDNLISELNDGNNTAFSASFEVKLDYVVTVETEPEVLFSKTPITVTGTTKRLDGTAIGNMPVEVILKATTGEKHLKTTSDAEGNYALTIDPSGLYAGSYAVYAGNLGSYGAAQDRVEIAGMKVNQSSTAFTWDVENATTTNGSFTVSNLSGVALSGVTIHAVNAPDNFVFVSDGPAVLDANGQLKVNYTITAAGETNGGGYELTCGWQKIDFIAESDEGVTTEFSGYFYSNPQTAVLTLSETKDVRTLYSGKECFYEFQITNTGFGDTGEIRIALPENDLIKIISNPVIENLAYGESATVTLKINPTALGNGLALNAAYTGSIGISAENAKSASFGFDYTFVSNDKGNISITLSDEWTYYAAEQPMLSGAKVSVYNAYTNKLVTTGYSDENGVVNFSDLAEGKYVLKYSADKHNNAQEVVTVHGGETLELNTFLQVSTVKYTWDVRKVELTDSYEIVLSTEFETNVPAPVVTISGPTAIPELAWGESTIMNFTVTNHGLIAAQDFSLTLPDLQMGYEWNVLNDQPVTIAPNSALPYTVLLTRGAGITNTTTVSYEPEISNKIICNQNGAPEALVFQANGVDCFRINTDGTFSFSEEDGMSYLFDEEGTLTGFMQTVEDGYVFYNMEGVITSFGNNEYKFSLEYDSGGSVTALIDEKTGERHVMEDQSGNSGSDSFSLASDYDVMRKNVTLYYYNSDSNNWEKIPDNDPASVGISTTDQVSVVIHGLNSSISSDAAWTGNIADSLVSANPSSKVIGVDWSGWASLRQFGEDLVLLLHGLASISIVDKVMDFLSDRIQSFASSYLSAVAYQAANYLSGYNVRNILGHSYGAHIGGMLGKYLGGVDTLIGIDPAEEYTILPQCYSSYTGYTMGGDVYDGWGASHGSASYVETYKTSEFLGTEKLYGDYNYLLAETSQYSYVKSWPERIWDILVDEAKGKLIDLAIGAVGSPLLLAVKKVYDIISRIKTGVDLLKTGLKDFHEHSIGQNWIADKIRATGQIGGWYDEFVSPENGWLGIINKMTNELECVTLDQLKNNDWSGYDTVDEDWKKVVNSHAWYVDFSLDEKDIQSVFSDYKEDIKLYKCDSKYVLNVPIVNLANNVTITIDRFNEWQSKQECSVLVYLGSVSSKHLVGRTEYQLPANSYTVIPVELTIDADDLLDARTADLIIQVGVNYDGEEYEYDLNKSNNTKALTVEIEEIDCTAKLLGTWYIVCDGVMDKSHEVWLSTPYCCDFAQTTISPGYYGGGSGGWDLPGLPEKGPTVPGKRPGGDSGGGGRITVPSIKSTDKICYYVFVPANASATPDGSLMTYATVMSDFEGEGRTENICAHVKVEFKQTAVMSREGFEGTLTLANEAATEMTNITFTATVLNSEGEDVSDLFEIVYNGADGFSITQNGDFEEYGLGNKGTGTFTVLYVPGRNTATEGPENYQFAGTVSYTDSLVGDVSIDLTPITLTVNPSPALQLHYFVERDVYADDPFTDAIEKSVPAEISVLVVNAGKGDARNFSLSGLTPEIVDNQKGLLLNYTMTDAALNGVKNDNGIVDVNFGTVAANTSAVAQWWYETNIQGHYSDYSVNFRQMDYSYVDLYGNVRYVAASGREDISLIESADIHELIRSVQAGDDDLPDFLVDDLADDGDTPDTLYLSTGAVEDVNAVFAATSSGTFGTNDVTITLTADFEAGWNYLRILDPGNGDYELTGIIRDGETLNVRNYWQTDRYYLDEFGVKYENRLHLLDYAEQAGTVEYTLTYTARDKNPLEVTSISGADSVVKSAVGTVNVTFNKAVNASSFTWADIDLFRQGDLANDLITDAVTVTQINDKTFVIGNLGELTAADGYYQLIVRTDGITDTVGNAGSDGKALTWTMAAAVPAVASIGGIDDVMNSKADSVEITFTSSVNAATLMPAVFRINGVSSNELVIAPVGEGGTKFTVSGISGLLNEGNNVLGIDLTQVAGINGIAGLQTSSREWTIDLTAPAVREISESLGVSGAAPTELVFEATEDVTVSADALTLKKDGVAIASDSLHISVDGRMISVTGIATGSDGAYELELALDKIEDAAGNVGSGTAVRTWTIDKTAPAQLAGFSLAAFCDLGESDSDGRTSTRDLTLVGTLPEAGLHVRIYQQTGTRARTLLRELTPDGTSLETAVKVQGGHSVLVAELTDASGNTSETTLSVFVDELAVSAKFLEEFKEVLPESPDSISFELSEEIEGLTAANFILSKDDEIVPLDGMSIVQTNALTYVLNGIDASANGAYTLSLDMTGLVKKSTGLACSGIQSTGWSIYHAEPPAIVSTSINSEQMIDGLATFSIAFSAAMNCDELIESGAIIQAVRIVEVDSNNDVVRFIALDSDDFQYIPDTNTLVWNSAAPLSEFGNYRLVLDTGMLKSEEGVSLAGSNAESEHSYHASEPSDLSAQTQSGGYSVPVWYDYDGDGKLDLLVGEKATDTTGRIRVLLNIGSVETPSFGDYSYLPGTDGDWTVDAANCLGVAPRFADVNGDGADDLVYGTSDGRIEYALKSNNVFGTGISLFADGTAIDVGNRAVFDLIDWNGDGHLDIVSGAQDGQVYLFVNNGDWTFAAAQTLPVQLENGWSAPAVADLDGDGDLDIVSGDANGNLYRFLNNGNGTFVVTDVVSGESDRSRPFICDVNGDGILDITVGYKNGKVSVLYGKKGNVVAEDFHINSSPVFSGTPSAEVEDYQVTLSWEPASDDSGISGYKVRIGNTEYQTTGTTLILTDVDVGTYSYQVGAYDEAGLEGWSSPSTFEVKDVTPPVLGGLPSGKVWKNAVRFSWEPASDNVAIAGYRVELNGQTYDTGLTVQFVSGLDIGDYEYRLGAVDTSGLITWSEKQFFTVTELADTLDHTLTEIMPTANYGPGCVASSIGMLLGYYDKYGYCGFDVSDLIPGEIMLKSRNFADALLNMFIATPGYASRFVGKNESAERPYTLTEQNELNTAAWDSLADWLGTGQTWRGNDDYATAYYYGSLNKVKESQDTYSVSGTVLPVKFADFKYGLSLFVESVNYKLDGEMTRTVKADTAANGSFSFADFAAEIDAGRGVLISLVSSDNLGHMVLGYGYNEATGEIIFDDTSESGRRMVWNGTCLYAGHEYRIQSVTTVVLDTDGLKVLPPVSVVVPQTQTWEKIGEAAHYIVEYSLDNFKHCIQLVVDSNSLDSFQMPAGNYQMRIKEAGGSEWTNSEPVIAEEPNDEPELLKSNADGNADIFFVNTAGTWEIGYVARHVGSADDVWSGTREHAALFGKNKLTDIVEGSTDANVLLMTDDSNGDALFVDDIFSDSPNKLGLSQSRIAQIDEIRAGAGDDIVDMSSQRFEYIGDGLTIRGGSGNDTIWANKGDNWLFGDAGNDRIVGASGNDVIAGGIGNDRMHGGGGNDVFTFCENWGIDTVEQLATGSVALWFASGSIDNWDEATLTYTDGDNSVKVSGVAAEKVTLKFGDDGSTQFASLTSMGAFFDATTERIFEEPGKGMLASL